MLVRPSHPAPFALLALLALACAKGPPSGGVGTYRGVATGLNQIGVLQVTVKEADKGPLPATGTLNFPDKSIELTGTLDKSKTQLTLTSSDGYTMVGESRPTYVYGSYTNATGDDMGAFGLILEKDGSTVELFCGSLLDTSTNETKGTTLPLAITAVPGGDAVCVGPNFAWLGGFATDDKTLGCTSMGEGKVDGKVNATSGNQWGTGATYGTWAVTPCASNGAGGGDGGVSDGGGAEAGTSP